MGSVVLALLSALVAACSRSPRTTPAAGGTPNGDAPPSLQRILPYDLVSSGPLDTGRGEPCGPSAPRWDDLNNIPKNPFWGYQVTDCAIPSPHRQCPQGTMPIPSMRFWGRGRQPPAEYWYTGDAPCTHIRVTDDSSFWCGPHIDFGPVTYEGRLRWEGYSGRNLLGDDDYQIKIYRTEPPDDDRAMYSGSEDHIEIEFNAGETVDVYGPDVRWWRDLKNAVDQSDASAGRILDGREAIIIAPADLDGSHDYSVELHPAWLFMIRVATGSSSDDWAFFVRNWGNKGGCGSDDHQLPLQDISVLLERAGSVGGHIGMEPSSGTELAADNPAVESISHSWLPGRGVVATFHLPPPAEHGWMAGYLHVVWAMSEAAPSPRPLIVELPAERRASGRSEDRPEAALTSLIAGLSAEQRSVYLKEWSRCRESLAKPAKGAVRIRRAIGPPDPPGSPMMGKVVHSLRQPRRCRVAALCKLFQEGIPGHARVCGGIRAALNR
jgi:hypothetical protein